MVLKTAMRCLCAALVVLIGITQAVPVTAATASKDYAALFEAFKEQHAKVYAHPEAENAAFRAFSQNEDRITAHNARGLSYSLGHNEYSDMDWDTFFVPGVLSPDPGPDPEAARVPPVVADVRANATVRLESLPTEVDWVAKGAVTFVKNQGQCGSCWSFAATGALEGAYFIATGKLQAFSEEELVQCNYVKSLPPCLGCKGGQSYEAFNYIKKHGLATETAYPYTSSHGDTGSCRSQTPASVVGLDGYTSVGGWSFFTPWESHEADLQAAVAQQPVAVNIEADQSAFQLYQGGVIDSDSCGTSLDHAVLVVGYGHDAASGKDYWKVKNSWGPTWGEQGYVRIARGKDMCGIGKQPTYPTGVKDWSADQ